MSSGRRRYVAGGIGGTCLLALVGLGGDDGLFDEALVATVLAAVITVSWMYALFEPYISRAMYRTWGWPHVPLGHKQKRAIHERLNELANEGDHVYNSAHIAHQIATKNKQREDEYFKAGWLGRPDHPLNPQPVPEWWKDYEAWFHKVFVYLKTPGLVTTYRDRWRAQEPDMPDSPEGKPPLSDEVRSEQTKKVVRLKQALLREWARDFRP